MMAMQKTLSLALGFVLLGLAQVTQGPHDIRPPNATVTKQGPAQLRACPSKLSVGPREWERLEKLRLTFEPWKSHGHKVILRIFAQPSGQAEWMLTVYQPQSETPFVELVRAKQPLEYTKAGTERIVPQVRVWKRGIARDLLTSLDEVAQRSLLDAGIPADYFEPPTSVCLDGILFTFIRGQACGWIVCREAESPVDRLVQLAHVLARYAESESIDENRVVDHVSKFLGK